MYKILTLNLLIMCFLACRTTKDNVSNLETRLQYHIDSIYNSNPKSVGILVHTEFPKMNTSWSGAIGYADKVTKTKVQPQQTFLIASMTKTYVSAVILRLVEEDKLILKSSIDNYLSVETRQLMSNAGYALQKIMIENLLSHTSGINNYVVAPEFESKLLNQPQHQWTRDEQIKIAMLQMDKVGEPGYQYKYSDTNYLLLTEIIEQVTGKAFSEVISELLSLDKIGCTSTWFEGLEPAPSVSLPLAHQYVEKLNLDTYNLDKSFDLFGGGGLASTTQDVALFVHKMFNGKIFKNKETLKLLLTKIETQIPSEDDYRFGIWKEVLDGQTAYVHAGFWGTIYYHFPDLNATVSIAILNQDQFHLQKDIIKIILEEYHY